MNYQKHYNLLIERAKFRDLKDYTENHHIIPRCMGGLNTKENLVRLTPEEHYLAHQLLVKIYPDNTGLVSAALMMTVDNSKRNSRLNNKVYGWLKRKYQKIAKQRIGSKNGTFGSFWITNGISNKKIKDEIPEGWK